MENVLGERVSDDKKKTEWVVPMHIITSVTLENSKQVMIMTYVTQSDFVCQLYIFTIVSGQLHMILFVWCFYIVGPFTDKYQ
jgi:hypothetical protein